MGYLSNFNQVRVNAATFTRLSPKCSCSHQQTSTSVNPLLLTSASRFPQRNPKGVSPHGSLHLTYMSSKSSYSHDDYLVYNIVLLKRVLTVSGLDTADLRLVWFQNATCMLYLKLIYLKLKLSYLLLSASFWWSLGKCTLPTWNPDRFLCSPSPCCQANGADGWPANDQLPKLRRRLASFSWNKCEHLEVGFVYIRARSWIIFWTQTGDVSLPCLSARISRETCCDKCLIEVTIWKSFFLCYSGIVYSWLLYITIMRDIVIVMQSELKTALNPRQLRFDPLGKTLEIVM